MIADGVKQNIYIHMENKHSGLTPDFFIGKTNLPKPYFFMGMARMPVMYLKPMCNMIELPGQLLVLQNIRVEKLSKP